MIAPSSAAIEAAAKFWEFLNRPGTAQIIRERKGFRTTAEVFAQFEEEVVARYTITDERVEMAAKALYEADDPWHSAFPWPHFNREDEEGIAKNYRRLARTVLETLNGNAE